MCVCVCVCVFVYACVCLPVCVCVCVHGCHHVTFFLINSQAKAKGYAALRLEDLNRLATLGAGGFGTVELVALPDGERAALKMVAKEHIVANAQEDHVRTSHPFFLFFLLYCAS